MSPPRVGAVTETACFMVALNTFALLQGVQYLAVRVFVSLLLLVCTASSINITWQSNSRSITVFSVGCCFSLRLLFSCQLLGLPIFSKQIAFTGNIKYVISFKLSRHKCLHQNISLIKATYVGLPFLLSRGKMGSLDMEAKEMTL